MKSLKLTGQFKKDLKRYRHKAEAIAALEVVLNYLENEIPIPSEYRPHPLTGDYRGYLECHVENDILLIWFDREKDCIKLVRFGTHSELFG